MADTKSEAMTLLGVEIRELGAPGDNDAGLHAAVAKLEEDSSLWYAAKSEAEHGALLRRWKAESRISLSASVAACVPQTRAGLLAKADYALRDWRERDPDPDRYARMYGALASSLEHALAALQEADRG